MRHSVCIHYSRDRTIEVQIQADQAPQAKTRARMWLDQCYEDLNCEPIRASGKLLLIDKVLAIAITAGYDELKNNKTLLDQFANACALILDRPEISIDTLSLTVTF